MLSLPSRVSLAVASFLVLGCLAIVVADGHRALAGITRPFDIDQFRDIAAAQSIVDGHPLRDPFYRGETIRYNPLLSVTIAAISRVAGSDVASTFVQSGPFLNALAPAVLFVMTAALFGEWPALIAVVSLVFSPPHDNPAWASPTYSPWLFPATFAPALFYAGILLCYVAIRRNQPRSWMAAGVTLGLTFLAHTAPAMILGTCCVMSVLWAREDGSGDLRGRWARRPRALALVLGTAAVVGAPLIWSIVGHYRLHIVNPTPHQTSVYGTRIVKRPWLRRRAADMTYLGLAEVGAGDSAI